MLKTLYVIVLIIFSQTVVASEIDTKLQNYIKEFQLTTIKRPTIKSKALFLLGRKLFTSNILSGNDNISCSECHQLSNNTMDSLPLALGEGATGISNARKQNNGRIIARNSPALFNLND